MKESDILKLCMIEASKLGAIVFRNNTGVLKDKTGRPVKYGLCVGSSDIIGMGPPPDSKFLAIEVKVPGKNPTEKQENFLNVVRANGGIAGVARCPGDVKKILLGC